MFRGYSWSRLDHRKPTATSVSWSTYKGYPSTKSCSWALLLRSRVGYGAAFPTDFLYFYINVGLEGLAGTGLKPGVLYTLRKSSTQVTPSWPILFILRKYNSHFCFREKNLNFHQSYLWFTPWIDAFTFVYSFFWTEERHPWDFSGLLNRLTFYPVISVVLFVFTQRTRADNRHLTMEWPQTVGSSPVWKWSRAALTPPVPHQFAHTHTCTERTSRPLPVFLCLCAPGKLRLHANRPFITQKL